MKKGNIFIFTAFIIASLGFGSCTNLDEETFDKLPIDQFGKNAKEINALVGPIYRTLKGVYPGNYFLLSECSSDMAVTPTRKGGDWWDGGQFKELRYHTWTPSTSLVKDSYNSAVSAISLCNRLQTMLSEDPRIENKEAIIAEIRGVRAYWYYMLLDYYGNVPIVTDFKVKELPSTNSKTEVYNFILSELNDIKDVVRTDVSIASYGKITRGVVYTLLAKMYLNAAVWNPAGGDKWLECIAATDEVIKLPYIIEPNWKQNFMVKNENSKEIIFPIIFSTSDGGNHIAQRTLHYLAAPSLGLKIGTWNGICAMPEYVRSFDPADKRVEWSFLTGEMKDPATGLTYVTAHGRPLIHTVDVTMKYGFDSDGWGQTEQEDGARCWKWEFESGQNGDAENDMAIFRLADVYLMKAEALVRAGGDIAEATRLVNVIRKRAFDDPAKLLTTVTLDDVYKERRFELAWEISSRQDMIRFGTFLNAIPNWKGVTTSKSLLFPIPRAARDANPNLTQNPGY